MRIPTSIDCIFGWGEGSEVASLNKQFSDQFSPISSTAAAWGSGVFCLLRPAASSSVGSSAMARSASGMARDQLHLAQPGSPSCMHACGLSAWQARAARQSWSSLLTFLSFPCFPSNSDLHHLAWVHQLCCRRDPAQAAVIRCSAQLLMFLSLSLLTLPVLPVTINSTTSGGEALCLLTSRLSWGYAWTMLYRLGLLLQQHYRSLVFVAAMSNSL